MIDENDFVARLTPIFESELDKSGLKISLDTAQDNMPDWDSLAHVRLVVGIENEFGILFDVSEIETIKSVRGFYDAVVRHGTA